MSCRIRAVQHKVRVDWLTHTPRFQKIKYARKLSILLLFIEVQQTFSFPFFLLRHNKCLDASVLTTAVFELVKQFYATEIGA